MNFPLLAAQGLRANKYVSLAIFMAVIVIAGSFLGLIFSPGDWYDSLCKPGFVLPEVLMAPAWLVVYCIVATAGWYIWWMRLPRLTMLVWLAQLALVLAWHPVYFGFNMLWPGIALLAGLAVTTLGLMILLAKWNLLLVWAYVPVLGWAVYTRMINFLIVVMN